MTRLEQARLDGHLTVEDLASKTGVSARTIYKLEARQGGAWDGTLFKLAEFLGVPASELLQPVDVTREAA